ncbi:hypothetical protein KQI38_04185 [Tissierella carlieri]|uniref:Uncharacterized protein n=1 Tax=Tissierella carlieri TaxID=689904 RepID=A0ABT1SB74_9FIRM|nr:hypothetical protein [Tissierella carlieri]MBU5311214.1 hypothetical protein [Tissierella carlieri]MCQ4923723.1 hypothetical protein [Tissierella carlieri]
MDKRNYKLNKNLFKYSNGYYNKLISRMIFVLVTLLIILAIKMMNTKTTNNIIKIIEKNIYYDFSLKEDGKKVKDYLVKVVVDSKDTIEEFTDQFNKNNKPD